MQDLKPQVANARAYHHGDLRHSLIEHGLEMLEQRNIDGLGLRELAREIGVSPPAIYRHFSDKNALLRALAAEGLHRLGGAQAAAFEKTGGGTAGFSASGRAYVHYALEHPALFKLIFSYAPKADVIDAPPDAAATAMLHLREHISEIAPAGTPPEQLRIYAIRAWSQVHGLAMLLLDGQMKAGDAMIEAVLKVEGLAGG
jgi:AcrR family transcriptional regulator